MKSLLTLALLVVMGCSKADASGPVSEHPGHECGCEVKLELKKFPVKPGVAPGCPAGQSYVLYQGYFSDKDGTNAWCNKIVQECHCDDHVEVAK